MSQKGSTLLSMLLVILIISIVLFFMLQKEDGVSSDDNQDIDIAQKIAMESYISTYIHAIELKVSERVLYQGVSLIGKYSVLELDDSLDVSIYVNKPSEGVLCIDDGGIVTQGSFKIDKYIVHYENSKAIVMDLDEVEDIMCSE